ncbi:MAG: tetratricopeptide repeat protein [Myxococcota bacterium]|nr:tetratricopeptide repeat protein [Myxococcota bacterium]
MEVARLKAEALVGAKQYKLAQRVVETALKTGDDEEGVLRMLLGRSLEGQGRLKEAVSAYVASDGKTMRRVKGHLRAGVLVAIDGRCPEALPLFLAAAAREQASAEILKHMGNCKLIVGDLTGALETLEQAYAADDSDLDIVVPLAQALERSGDVVRAKEMYRQALGIKHGDQRAKMGLARIEGATSRDTLVVELGEGTQTETEIEAQIDVEALEVAAHAAFREGKYATASRLYGEAVKALGDEASASLLRNRAVALHKAGQGPPAIRAYEAALAASPQDAELHYLLGTLLASQGRNSQARRALRAALEREPSRWKARFELGLLELRQGRHREAAEVFETLTRQRPDDRSAWQNLVKARTEAGDRQGALEALSRMHSAHPRDAQTLLTMVALLQTMDRDEEASALLTDACSNGIQEACP